MGSTGGMYQAINAMQSEINSIQSDITAMEALRTANDTLRYNYTVISNHVANYDMTVGDTWKKDLCDVAEAYQTVIKTEVESIRSATWNMCHETYLAIENAKAKIENLQSQIDSLYEQIRAEEEAERAAAEAANSTATTSN